MKRISTLLVICLFFAINAKSQNNISQNQQNININLPVIEKTVYVDRYRTVYVDKPRVAKKLDKPILLLGYLWVYPEDLGNFNQVPASVLLALNNQCPYGRDNWRIPTPDELAVLEANADAVGLGNDIYLATDHRNGVLRPVSTGQTRSQRREQLLARGEVVKVGETYWQVSTQPCGMISVRNDDIYNETITSRIPEGWRLPTTNEVVSYMENLRLKKVDVIWYDRYGTPHFYELKDFEPNCVFFYNDFGRLAIVGYRPNNMYCMALDRYHSSGCLKLVLE